MADVRLGRAIINFFADNEQFIADVRKGGRALSEQEKSVRDLQRTFRRSSGDVTNFIRNQTRLRNLLVGAGAAATGLALLGQNAIDFASRMNQAVRSTNIGSRAFQELHAVLQIAGFDLDETRDLVADINREFDEFRSTGGGAIADIFDQFDSTALERYRDQIRGVADDTEQQVALVIRLVQELRQGQGAFLLSRFGVGETDATRLLGVLRALGPERVRQVQLQAQQNALTDEQLEQATQLDVRLKQIGATIRAAIFRRLAQSGDQLNRIAVVLERRLPDAIVTVLNITEHLLENFSSIVATVFAIRVAARGIGTTFGAVAAAVVALRGGVAGLSTLPGILRGVGRGLARTSIQAALVYAGIEGVFFLIRQLREDAPRAGVDALRDLDQQIAATERRLEQLAARQAQLRQTPGAVGAAAVGGLGRQRQLAQAELEQLRTRRRVIALAEQGLHTSEQVTDAITQGTTGLTTQTDALRDQLGLWRAIRQAVQGVTDFRRDAIEQQQEQIRQLRQDAQISLAPPGTGRAAGLAAEFTARNAVLDEERRLLREVADAERELQEVRDSPLSGAQRQQTERDAEIALQAAQRQFQAFQRERQALLDRAAAQGRAVTNQSRLNEAIEVYVNLVQATLSPSQLYQRDLQSLDLLLRRNVISQQQYNASVAQLNRLQSQAAINGIIQAQRQVAQFRTQFIQQNQQAIQQLQQQVQISLAAPSAGGQAGLAAQLQGLNQIRAEEVRLLNAVADAERNRADALARGTSQAQTAAQAALQAAQAQFQAFQQQRQTLIQLNNAQSVTVARYSQLQQATSTYLNLINQSRTPQQLYQQQLAQLQQLLQGVTIGNQTVTISQQQFNIAFSQLQLQRRTQQLQQLQQTLSSAGQAFIGFGSAVGGGLGRILRGIGQVQQGLAGLVSLFQSLSRVANIIGRLRSQRAANQTFSMQAQQQQQQVQQIQQQQIQQQQTQSITTPVIHAQSIVVRNQQVASQQVRQAQTQQAQVAAQQTAQQMVGQQATQQASVTRMVVNRLTGGGRADALLSALAGIASSVAGAAAGSRQHGGPVAQNRPYVVGEDGDELFIPRQAGYIVSNETLQRLGAGQTFVFRNEWNIEAEDPLAVERTVLRLLPTVNAAQEQQFKRQARRVSSTQTSIKQA